MNNINALSSPKQISGILAPGLHLDLFTLPSRNLCPDSVVYYGWFIILWAAKDRVPTFHISTILKPSHGFSMSNKFAMTFHKPHTKTVYLTPDAGS